MNYHGVMVAKEHTLSDFLQHSDQILPDLASGEVVLQRRSGEDLVIMTRGQSAALASTLRVFVSLHSRGLQSAESVLPWLALLDPRDRDACLRELGEVAVAAVLTGQLRDLQDTLYQWEATALATWDARHAGVAGSQPEDEPVPIPRPSR